MGIWWYALAKYRKDKIQRANLLKYWWWEACNMELEMWLYSNFFNHSMCVPSVFYNGGEPDGTRARSGEQSRKFCWYANDLQVIPFNDLTSIGLHVRKLINIILSWEVESYFFFYRYFIHNGYLIMYSWVCCHGGVYRIMSSNNEKMSFEQFTEDEMWAREILKLPRNTWVNSLIDAFWWVRENLESIIWK